MPHVISVMPFQKEFVTASERFLTLMAGRRAGKTDAIKGRIKVRTRKPGFAYTYITPLYAQCLEVYRELTRDVSYQHCIKWMRERPHPHYQLQNGSRVAFKSFQRPEGLRGTGMDEICIDESQDPSVTEYDVKTIVLPMLGDRRGTLVLAGQFRGHDWRYEQFWLRGQQTIDGQPNPLYRPQYKSWQIHSSLGFVFQGADGVAELELQKSITPRAVWEQEWACIPSANANAVFLPHHVDAIVGGDVTSSGQYVAGLDLGRVVDQSAFVVLACTQDCATVVHAEKFPQRQEHAEQAMRASQLAGQYRCPVVIDVTGGATGGHQSQDTYVKFYREKVKDLREFYWQRANKEKVIAQLALDIEQRRLRIPAQHGELLKELRQYEYEYRGGYYDYHAPKGLHDDFVAALSMAVWGWHRGWTSHTGSGNPLSLRF